MSSENGQNSALNEAGGFTAFVGRSRWRRYAAAAVVSAICTAVALLMFPFFDLANLIMVYLLGTTVVALRLGRGPASASAIVNVAAFDFFFVRPRFTMAVADVQYLLTFAVMLIVALTIATLVASVRAQTQLAALRERHAEMEKLRSTLLGSISHDLRTPLAVIAGASSALSDATIELDGPTRARLVASIEVKAREMSELISNVLDLMRFESGEVRLRRDWQTVDDLVGTALRRVGEALRDHSVEVDLPPGLPEVYVDAPLLSQVLGNLLENGARHTPAGTRLRIAAEARQKDVLLIVEDDGPGLPGGDIERLFDKFHRGHDEGSTGGAGLGLAICRAIIRAHGGEITAENRPQGGARFTFTLDTEAPPA